MMSATNAAATTPGPLPASADLRPILRRLAAEPARHARFANTLSMLEYVGARKILKSQPAATFTVELLAHAAEEIRHALSLKKLALRLDPAVVSYTDEHLLHGRSANAYMQDIDRGAEADLRQPDAPDRPERGSLPWINYLYTTLLVEERAGSLYPLYAEILAPLGHAPLIHAIIREEESHLAQVVAHLLRDDPDGPARLARLRETEACAFDAWFAALAA